MQLSRPARFVRIMLVVCCIMPVFGASVREHACAAEYTFGVVPQFEQRKLHAIWKPVLDELAKRTGFTFTKVTTLTVRDFEREYVRGGFDFAYMNPYFMLIGDNPYIPLVRDRSALRGILVVRKDSPVATPAELKGKTVAFPSPNAIGASLLIRADLERLFKATVVPLYVKTHSSVYLHVVQGLVDAGGGVEKSLQEQDEAIRGLIRTIYTTRDMPSHPIAAHPRVPAKDRETVRRALLDMAGTDEGGKLLSAIPIRKITAADSGDYAHMRDWRLDAYWDPFWKDD